MQFEGMRRSGQALNLTPLIDIVFLLLIFFMLTAHFVKDESIAIQLPQAESAVSRDDDTAVVVLLDNDGKIHLAGNVIEADALEEALRQTLQGRSEKWVTLHGDRAADLDHAVKILDAARKAGAEAVDVVTEKP
jgi:biopolymer transport protein ExbD